MIFQRSPIDQIWACVRVNEYPTHVVIVSLNHLLKNLLTLSLFGGVEVNDLWIRTTAIGKHRRSGI